MLHKIIEQKKEEVQLLKRKHDSSTFLDQIEEQESPHRFLHALSHPNRDIGLIAEVKKASPSKGIIRSDFQPLTIAQQYERAGADAISVLTDELFFQGSLTYLVDIKKHVSLPLLRKDFIIDELQVFESRAAGADAILLIANILSRDQIRDYADIAYSLNMDVLFEIHDDEDFDKIQSMKPNILGINNRDLKSFQTDIRTTASLVDRINWECLVISESGIHSQKHVQDLTSWGVNGLLIGEHFMRQDSIIDAVEGIMSVKRTIQS